MYYFEQKNLPLLWKKKLYSTCEKKEMKDESLTWYNAHYLKNIATV